MPAWRAVITSCTVDIPTTPAPSARSMRTSAGVSYDGPAMPAYTASRSGCPRTPGAAAAASARSAGV